MSATLDERPGGHVLLFDDHRVTQLLVELRAVRLQTYSLHDALELRVGVPFTLRQADGDTRRVDPAEPEQLAPLLTLVGRRVEALEADARGGAEVAFSDGTVLTVAPHPREEAWQLQGAGGLEGLVYRSPPGGGRPWTAD